MLLLIKSKNNYPFLISTDPLTSDWTVVAYPQKLQSTSSVTKEISVDYFAQDDLVRKYVEYWFTIDKNYVENESLWQQCSADDCIAPEQFDPTNKKCTLFCLSSKELFEQFTTVIVPEYRARMTDETMKIEPQTITKDSSIDGLWQYYGTVTSSVRGIFNVLVFVELGHQPGKYPATLGYYVKGFNAYRIPEQ